MTSSVKHQSCLLNSEHLDTHGAGSVCVMLDRLSMNYWADWMGRDSVLLEEDPRGNRREVQLAEPIPGQPTWRLVFPEGLSLCLQQADLATGSSRAAHLNRLLEF